METITVETSEYEFSHGKRPRGRGTWAFTFDTRRYDRIEEVWWTPLVTWSDARRLRRRRGPPPGSRNRVGSAMTTQRLLLWQGVRGRHELMVNRP